MQDRARSITTTPEVDEAGTVLIVDDDEEIRDLLVKFLSRNGFVAVGAGDEPGMQAALRATAVDLVILDLMLPRVSGLDICRALRAKSSVPILILTAKDEVMDRVVGLELGADDYLTKPFNPRELLARVRAILRRSKAEGGAPGHPRGSLLEFAGWTLDVRRRLLLSPDGVAVDLSVAEFDLLMVFLEHPRQVLTREELVEATGGRGPASLGRSVDVQVSRLRRRFEADPSQPPMIKTVRGAGYMFLYQVSRT
jgi:two-component system, OmpR family, response regulator